MTGKAGTGKTTFLKYLIKHTTKKCVIAAPTGIAAINAGGVDVYKRQVLKSMESKKEKCQKEYEDAVKHKDEIESKLNQLKQQDAYFVDFKTGRLYTSICV